MLHNRNMPRMFKFNNIIHPQQLPTPSSPIASNDETANSSMPSTPTSHLSQSPGAESPSSSSASSRGVNNNSSRLNNRRRRTLRNETKRPYHSPNHVSPPHDKPMTKNDIYFALDCEVSRIMLSVYCQLLHTSHSNKTLSFSYTDGWCRS